MKKISLSHMSFELKKKTVKEQRRLNYHENRLLIKII